MEKKLVLSESRIAFCQLFIVQVKKVCYERKVQGELLGCFFHCTLKCLPPHVPTTSFPLMVLWSKVVSVLQWNKHPNSKTQQKITYLLLYCVKSDWFYSIQIWSLKTIFHMWKPFWTHFRSLRTLWNHNTNVKNILASLTCIFSLSSSF